MHSRCDIAYFGRFVSSSWRLDVWSWEYIVAFTCWVKLLHVMHTLEHE